MNSTSPHSVVSIIFRTFVLELVADLVRRSFPSVSATACSFPPGRPLSAGNVPQPGCGQVEGGLAVRKRAHHTGSPSDLAHDPLQRVVGADPAPVLVWIAVVGERLVHRLLELVRHLLQSYGLELGCDFHCLGPGGGAVLLGVDHFQHQ